jgi:intermembrane lipid transfer protein VPS13
MQNLEITIRNLHISYETISTTKLGHPFSFGLTIHHLQMTVKYYQKFLKNYK